MSAVSESLFLATIELMMLITGWLLVLPAKNAPPRPDPAVLFVTVLFLRVSATETDPPDWKAPPLVAALLPEKVLFWMVTFPEPPKRQAPPAPLVPVAEFPENVELLTVTTD